MEYVIHTTTQLSLALKSRRKAQKLTQTEVADRVGLLPKTISALESTPGRSSVESLFKLLAALDLELVVRTKNQAETRRSQGEW